MTATFNDPRLQQHLDQVLATPQDPALRDNLAEVANLCLEIGAATCTIIHANGASCETQHHEIIAHHDEATILIAVFPATYPHTDAVETITPQTPASSILG